MCVWAAHTWARFSCFGYGVGDATDITLLWLLLVRGLCVARKSPTVYSVCAYNVLAFSESLFTNSAVS